MSPGYTRGQAGGTLLARTRAIIEDVLKRMRIHATQIDGQIGLHQLPPGTASIAPDGSGSIVPGIQTLQYRHVQASAATTWTIAHNLGWRPNVSATDGTHALLGDVTWSDANHVQIVFSRAVSGEAYLS